MIRLYDTKHNTAFKAVVSVVMNCLLETKEYGE